MTKSELRKLYLEKRRQLSSAERSLLSRAIADNFLRGFDLTTVAMIHCFISIEKFLEVDTAPIFEQVWTGFPEIQTAVPRVNYETGELESLKYSPLIAVLPGKWEIPEPSHNEFIDVSDIDIVIVPLVCFDESGHRVGYGKGYYDRFLAKCRADCLKIGLSYFDPVRVIHGAHDGDVRLDSCVTPDTVFEFAR